jgi:hypothetical protein
LQGQVAVEQFGTRDMLVANSGGLLQRSQVIDRSLMLWQQALAKEMGSFGIRVTSVGLRLIATQVQFNGGQRLF